jgi:methylmalonyl-CoA/ethylmalonyl-CoA epimerase
MSEQALGTTAVAQIAISVQDVEASARAWADTLGLPMPVISMSPPVEEAETEYHGQRTSGRIKTAVFHLGSLDLELMEPVGEPTTWNDQLVSHGNSVHHIAFRVQGMKDKLAYLGSKGFPLIQRGEYPGGRYAYADSGAKLGVILELLENDNVRPGAQ